MEETSTVKAAHLVPQVHSETLYVCNTCGLPVGDSSDWTANSFSENAVRLKGVTQFVGRGKTITSRDPHDAGSKYQSLSCTNCHNVLGKFYFCTPEPLKHKLNLFNFDKGVIRVYNFGEQPQQSVPDSEAPITVEMSQVYLEQIKKQKKLFEFLQKRLLKLEEKVLPSQQDIEFGKAKLAGCLA